MTYEEFIQSKSFVSEPSGFDIELDAIHPTLFGFQREIVRWALRRGKAAIFAGTGLGKCHGIDTPIIMYDGSVKMVQDIQTGDHLMGPDSKPRTVLSTTKGYGDLYRVNPIKGEPFICNDVHVLSLKTTSTVGKYTKDEIVNIGLDEYLKKDNKFKHMMKLWRTGVDFKASKLPVDPYVIGIWLGDGTKISPSITTSCEDVEVSNYLEKWASEVGLKVRFKHAENCIERHFIVSAINNQWGEKNILREIIRECVINDEKRIPNQYLINGIEERLELLAGLIDSDGYHTENCFEIVTKYPGLARDIAFLARSCGLAVSRKTVTKGIKSSGFTAQYEKLIIYGNTYIVPCKVERKKASVRKQKKDALKTGFSIEYLGKGDYYGFTLDGDHLYLLGDFTVTHNTLMQTEWSKRVHDHTGGRVLILAPLAVATQTAREAEKIDLTVHVCQDDSDVRDGVNITNYEKLHKFDLTQFTGIVLDECFPKGTMIDRVIKQGSVFFKIPTPIEQVKVGDMIMNASGVDIVSDVHRREVKYAIKITVGGKSIVSSPNHPYFTQRGWVGAQDLQPGDAIIKTNKAMQIVRDRVSTEDWKSKVLFDILQSEMASPSDRRKIPAGADMRMVRQNVHRRSVLRGKETFLRQVMLGTLANESTRTSSESSQSRNCKETRRQEVRMVAFRRSCRIKGIGTNTKFESDVQPRITQESVANIERNEAQTFRAWGEWEGINRAAGDSFEGTRRRMGSGICFVTGKTNTRLSNALQNRLSEYRKKNCYRSGWSITSQQKRNRQEEGFETSFLRVESLEVLEPGHLELERIREQDGSLYFYDIGATRHPSFSIKGLLVHNSSILKSYTSTTRDEIINGFQKTPYKLACTATPAPNDFMELGNHSEFLGVMSRTEMLSMFFVHDGGDTSKWRLKGHAEQKFWEWVSSWGVMIRKPSDLGHDDGAYELPPLNVRDVIVETGKAPEGYLFAMEVQTLQERQAARRTTIEDRCKKASEIVNATDEPFLVWCDYNAESELLHKLIPGSVEVKGSDSHEHKEDAMLGFAEGRYRVLVSKSSICGFGMNWQHCSNMVFAGISDSFEMQYQAIRRCYRFGQTKPVNVYMVTSDLEGAVAANVKRKEADFEKLQDEMSKFTRDIVRNNVLSASVDKTEYKPKMTMIIPDWLKGA